MLTSLPQRTHNGVGPKLKGPRLGVPSVNKYRVAACRRASKYIGAPIANHVTRSKIDSVVMRGAEQQSGLRFATAAAGILAVRTNADIVDGDAAPQLRVHSCDFGRIDETMAEIRLIRHDNDEKASRLEALNRRSRTGHKAEIRIPRGRERSARTQHNPVQHSVTVKKNGAPELHYHFVR